MSAYTNMLKNHVDKLQNATRQRVAEQSAPKVTVGMPQIQQQPKVSVGPVTIDKPAPQTISVPGMSVKATQPREVDVPGLTTTKWSPEQQDKVLKAYRGELKPTRGPTQLKVEESPEHWFMNQMIDKMRSSDLRQGEGPQDALSMLSEAHRYAVQEKIPPRKLSDGSTWPPAMDPDAATLPNGMLGYTPYMKNLKEIADVTFPKKYTFKPGKVIPAPTATGAQAYDAATQKALLQLAAGKNDGEA